MCLATQVLAVRCSLAPIARFVESDTCAVQDLIRADRESIWLQLRYLLHFPVRERQRKFSDRQPAGGRDKLKRYFIVIGGDGFELHSRKL